MSRPRVAISSQKPTRRLPRTISRNIAAVVAL